MNKNSTLVAINYTKEEKELSTYLAPKKIELRFL
jgi:hypothetical protein